MLIEASTIINLPLAATQSESKIGSIKKIIFNPENGEIIGLLVAPGGFLAKDRVLSSQDIVALDKNGVVTKSEENLLPIEEIIRIKEILKNKIAIIGQNAITESKHGLGNIYDVLIESGTLMIVKYYTKGLIEERILPADKVVSIDQKGVVFSDDVIAETSRTEVEGAAA